MQVLKEKNLQSKLYKKHNSFYSFEKKNCTSNSLIINKILEKKNNNNIYDLLSIKHKVILDKAIADLLSNNHEEDTFKLTENVISEIENIDETDILKYIVHRYRYEIFPKKKNIR